MEPATATALALRLNVLAALPDPIEEIDLPTPFLTPPSEEMAKRTPRLDSRKSNVFSAQMKTWPARPPGGLF